MDVSLPICGSRFLVSMSIFRPYLILGMTAMFRLTLGGSNEKLFVVWDRHRLAVSGLLCAVYAATQKSPAQEGQHGASALGLGGNN
jgi:hypothetical protein